MSAATAAIKDLTPQPAKKSLVVKFADKYGVDADKMLNTLKATAFQQKGRAITNEQMMALLIVADQYNLNPFTREIYAFPDKQNGIVPVVGVDGWSRIINGYQDCDGVEFRRSDNMVEMDGAKPCPEWMEVVIHRKDRSHPTVVREYLDEVYRDPFRRDGNVIKGPWQTHTKRMLRHKTLIQGARIAFGFVGIFDEDEAERIVEGEIIEQDEFQSEQTASVNDLILNGGQNGESQAIDGTDGEEPVTFTKIDLIAKINDANKEDDLSLVEDLSRSLSDEDKAQVIRKLAEKRVAWETA